MKVEAIPAFDDNYIWLLTDETGNRFCAVVDPGDEEPVLQQIAGRDLVLDAILITHKHFDHTGGVAGLKAVFPDAVVFGPGNESLDIIEKVVVEGQHIELPHMALSFVVIEVPGHTEGHIAYYGYSSLFCGDTLFAGGCGRVFSGTFEQLSASLEKIASLPGATKIYCAHEYTRANLGFAQWVEPHSDMLKKRISEVDELRSQGLPTVPSMLGLEMDTNPFLRVEKQNVVAAAENWAGRKLPTNAQVFTALRQWKDRDYD